APGGGGGPMAGRIAQSAFCLLYGRMARRHHWGLSLLAGSLAFAATTVALQSISLSLAARVTTVIGALMIALLVMPKDSRNVPAAPLPRWDIPVRLVVTTALVLVLTGLAPVLGPQLTGLLATFPLYGAILAGFAHPLQGPGP